MAGLNWVDQTIFTGDNLDVMRGLNSETVDLIYLDPPFCSDEEYEAPIGSPAEGASFKDFWDYDDVRQEEYGLLAEEEPNVGAIIHAAGLVGGKKRKAYLTMMSSRLLEMRRLLKPDGSIFLHCNDYANSYLRLVMDGIFGAARFKNAIRWKRTSSRSDAKRFGCITDTILYYSNSDKATWNPVYQPHDPEYVKKSYRHDFGDGKGPAQLDQLTGPGLRDGESGQPWRGIDPGERGNHWRTPTKGGMSNYIIEHNLIPGWPEAYPSLHQRLDLLDRAGLIYWPGKQGGMPRLKRYLASTKGNAACDMITDIPPLAAQSREYVGYPTQKPLKLLNRLIEAASSPGDMVLDPFCGCATACVSAFDLKRQWVGIDISPKAAELVAERLGREFGFFGQINDRTDIPKRTDVGKILPKHAHKPALYGKQEGNCIGCKAHFEYRQITVDRIWPEARGGQDNIENLQLLCFHCNAIKNKGTMAEFRARLKERGIGQNQ